MIHVSYKDCNPTKMFSQVPVGGTFIRPGTEGALYLKTTKEVSVYQFNSLILFWPCDEHIRRIGGHTNHAPTDTVIEVDVEIVITKKEKA